MIRDIRHSGKFYGSTTVGERGQIVIPQEARKDLKIKRGNKFLVLGGPKMVVLAKMDGLTQLAKHLSRKLSYIQRALKKKETK